MNGGEGIEREKRNFWRSKNMKIFGLSFAFDPFGKISWKESWFRKCVVDWWKSWMNGVCWMSQGRRRSGERFNISFTVILKMMMPHHTLVENFHWKSMLKSLPKNEKKETHICHIFPSAGDSCPRQASGVVDYGQTSQTSE